MADGCFGGVPVDFLDAVPAPFRKRGCFVVCRNGLCDVLSLERDPGAAADTCIGTRTMRSYNIKLLDRFDKFFGQQRVDLIFGHGFLA